MSSDRLTELLNLMSAMARDVGMMRTEFNQRFERLESRLERIEIGAVETQAQLSKMNGELRDFKKEFHRFGKMVMTMRTNIDDLDDRVAALESNTVAD